MIEFSCRATKPKWIMSVSLGSSRRDFREEISLGGHDLVVERRGTDGNLELAAVLLLELDGRVSAFGLGGINIFHRLGNHRFYLPEGRWLAGRAVRSPVVDGAGWKEVIEGRELIPYLERVEGFCFRSRRVLLVSLLDRYFLGKAFLEAGAEVAIGDALFALGLPIVPTSFKAFEVLAHLSMPLLRRVPISKLYPLGTDEGSARSRGVRFAGVKRFIRGADILAGDFHFIRQSLPADLEGKIVITTSVTEEDVRLVAGCGATALVTTSPPLAGRSPGANVMEAIFVSILGKEKTPGPEAYRNLYAQLRLAPRVVRF